MKGTPRVSHYIPAMLKSQRACHLSCNHVRYVQLVCVFQQTHADMILMPSQQWHDVCMTVKHVHALQGITDT